MAKSKAARPTRSTHVLRLIISLRDSHPVIWRRVVVPEEISLAKLHEIIQAAMGWWNAHLHQFEIEGTRYSDPTFGINDELFEDEEPVKDEKRIRLSQVCQFTDRFEYQYDFGDNWQHEIVIESREPADPRVHYPVCIGGERAGPPEDCGGTGGYENLIEQLADPEHEEHDSSLRWLGGYFNPDAFDPNFVNREKLWSRRW